MITSISISLGTSPSIALLLSAQGIYFALTGVWPLLHYKSFEKVTGPKTDVWLVKSTGALILAAGIQLIIAAALKDIDIPTVVAGMGTAFVLILIDVIYVIKKVVRKIYLSDATVQLIWIILWILYLI